MAKCSQTSQEQPAPMWDDVTRDDLEDALLGALTMGERGTERCLVEYFLERLESGKPYESSVLERYLIPVFGQALERNGSLKLLPRKAGRPKGEYSPSDERELIKHFHWAMNTGQPYSMDELKPYLIALFERTLSRTSGNEDVILLRRAKGRPATIGKETRDLILAEAVIRKTGPNRSRKRGRKPKSHDGKPGWEEATADVGDSYEVSERAVRQALAERESDAELAVSLLTDAELAGLLDGLDS